MNRRREREPALAILRAQHSECKKKVTCIVVRCRRGSSELKLPLADTVCVDCDECDYFPKNEEGRKRPDFVVAYAPGDPDDVTWVIVEMKGRVKSSQDTIEQLASGVEVVREQFTVRGYGQRFVALVFKSSHSRATDIDRINGERIKFGRSGIRVRVIPKEAELTKILPELLDG